MAKNNKIFEILVLFICFGFGFEVLAGMPKKFYRIDEHFYRSARPEREDVDFLRSIGIKTVIDLEWFLFRKIDKEREYITEAGMNFLHYPIGTLSTPKREDLLALVRYIADRRNQPVLIHCMTGSDRTGIVAAAYRILVQGWPVEVAVDEMRRDSFGHKKFLYGWDKVLYQLHGDNYVPSFPIRFHKVLTFIPMLGGVP